jgi:hypothetical protein
MHAKFRSVARGAAVVAIAFGSVSCGEVARTGRAPALLVIDALEAASGAAPDQLSGFLLSDVQTLVEQTIDGKVVMVPSIFNDIGEATLRIIMKDPGTGGLGVAPSDLNAITLRRYRIVYRRADGRNTPGADVPFPVDGGVTGTITATPSTVGFEMVRHQAKLEPPLRSLANLGGRLFISTIAEITFYGADLAGNEVQATGTISVSFGDYADPE